MNKFPEQRKNPWNIPIAGKRYREKVVFPLSMTGSVSGLPCQPGSGVGEEFLLADNIRIIEIHFAVEPVRDKLPFLGIGTDPAPRFVELCCTSPCG